jgi:hypothetical protein
MLGKAELEHLERGGGRDEGIEGVNGFGTAGMQ